jgi:plasmid stabilization system protein ParE
MAHDVLLTLPAQSDILALHAYLSDFNATTADRIVGELERTLRLDIAVHPEAYALFYVTGAPYRARLFRLSRRTQYWIIYEFRRAASRVDVLRVWNASRNPADFEL